MLLSRACRVAVALALLVASTPAAGAVGSISGAAPNDQMAAADSGPLPLPELPQQDGESTEEQAKTINVGGSTVKLDNLGPMIINADGTISRITNWDQMTAREQEVALKRIAKRNEERRQNLLREQPEQGSKVEL